VERRLARVSSLFRHAVTAEYLTGRDRRNRWGRPARRRSKRFSQRIRAFDSLKAKKLSPRAGVEGGDGAARRIGSQSKGRPEGAARGREAGGAMAGGQGLHYVRDRAKLLGS